MIIYDRGNAAKQWILTQLETPAERAALRVLDLGCGDGHVWRPFVTRFPTVEVTGIDTDRQAIARGQRDLEPGSRLRLRVADAQHAFDDAAFDVVTALSALEHVVDLPAFLATVWSALKPGGAAYLNYDAGHFRSRDLKERLMVPLSQMLARCGVEGPYMRAVDDRALQRLVVAQGFAIRHFRKHNIASLKGFFRSGSAQALAAWWDFEDALNRSYQPAELDALMWSSTLVVEKPV